MIRIAITPAPVGAIAATLPLGSVGFEAERDAQGELPRVARRMDREQARRDARACESYSDVILRLAKAEGRGVTRAESGEVRQP
jgi:hypothetical protein